MLRTQFIHAAEQAFAVNPAVALLGPRQCGKTTLAQQLFKKQGVPTSNYFDLENPLDLQRLDNPMLTLEELSGLIVIDEVQRKPELFQSLRVQIDRHRETQRYLILGSASRELLNQSSETLAGRISYLELTPFNAREADQLQTLWLRGGFPNTYLAKSDQISYQWRNAYIKTFLEKDIPALGINIPSEQLRRFWLMLTHYHGQVINTSELGRSMNLSHNTIKKYIDILSGTFMIRVLYPWHENLGKRQVKSPKIYFRDSGIYHALNRIETYNELLIQPQLGASWEGFSLEEIIRHQDVDAFDCYFWGTHAGAELDLLIIKGNKRIGFEFKYTDTPKTTKSMHIAMEALSLNELTVISPGDHNFPLTEKIRAVGLNAYLAKI